MCPLVADNSTWCNFWILTLHKQWHYGTNDYGICLVLLVTDFINLFLLLIFHKAVHSTDLQILQILFGLTLEDKKYFSPVLKLWEKNKIVKQTAVVIFGSLTFVMITLISYLYSCYDL